MDYSEVALSSSKINSAYENLSSCWVDYHSEIHVAPMREKAPALLMAFNDFFKNSTTERFDFYGEKFNLAFGKNRQGLNELKTRYDEIDFAKIAAGTHSHELFDKYQEYHSLLRNLFERSGAIFFPFCTSPDDFKVDKLRSIYPDKYPALSGEEIPSEHLSDFMASRGARLFEGLWSENLFEARLLFGYCRVLTEVFSVDLASEIYLSSAIESLVLSNDDFSTRNIIILTGVALAKRLFAVGMHTVGLSVTDRVKAYATIYCDEYPHIFDEAGKLDRFVDGTVRPKIRPSHPLQRKNVNRLMVDQRRAEK